MISTIPGPTPEPEYVSFDRPRVVRVRARSIDDMDELARFLPVANEEPKEGGPRARRGRPPKSGGRKPEFRPKVQCLKC